MTTLTITSKKLGRTVTFTHWAEEGKTSAMYADTNGKPGVLGTQCMDHGVCGSALRVTEKTARRVAYRWLLKNFSEE